jgi:hypothetical protein
MGGFTGSGGGSCVAGLSSMNDLISLFVRTLPESLLSEYSEPSDELFDFWSFCVGSGAVGVIDFFTGNNEVDESEYESRGTESTTDGGIGGQGIVHVDS